MYRMNTYLYFGLFGAGAGLGRAIIGYMGVIQHEPFNWKLFLRTIFLNCVIGALAGFFVTDVKAAVLAGLAGEEFLHNIIKLKGDKAKD